MFGRVGAPNALHIFSDFQCPYCQQLWDEVLPTWEGDPGNYRISHLHFPPSSHRNAFAAAEASECAAAQGHFWAYADRLFQNFQAWTPLFGAGVPKEFTRYAQHLKLNTAQFQSCLRSRRFQGTVTAQIQAGKKLDVRGTPTVFLNGIKMLDYTSAAEAARIRAVTTGKMGALGVVTRRLAQFR